MRPDRLLVILLSPWLLLSDVYAASSATDTAKRIYRRLTSSSIYASDPRLAKMVEAVEAGDLRAAARVASADQNFYNVTLRNWAAPWSSQNGSAGNEFDDMQALAVGMVRDRLDFRLLLTGNFDYRARDDLGFPPLSPTNNIHYREVELSGLNLADILARSPREGNRQIGIFGSRAFAKEYYSGGTNRRAVTSAFEHFLCLPISAWREPALPDDFVRRDVNRIPAGSIQEYQTECRGCHAPMDALSGAFVYMDFTEDQLQISDKVLAKFNLHPEVFPDGHIVQDGTWENYLAVNQNAAFGWQGETAGNSLEQFAAMMSKSRAFAQCMVRRAVAEVCFEPAPRNLVKRLAHAFENNRYDMREIFELAAIDEQCNAR